MIVIPKDDLYIYQTLFEIEFSKELIKERILLYCNEFRNDIEKVQKCKFEELDNVFSKDPINLAVYLLEWLKFNFTNLQQENDDLNNYYNKSRIELENEYWNNWEIYNSEYNSENDFIESFRDMKKEYERHKRIRYLKEFIITFCKNALNAIKIKNEKHIPNALEKLSFSEQYEKFQEIMPEMIKYKKEFGKRVFWRGTISKQFLRWYLKTKKGNMRYIVDK